MLADQFLDAAASARTTAALDSTARLLWRAHAEGHLTEADTKVISEAIGARRAAFSTRPPILPRRAAGGHPRRPLTGCKAFFSD